MSLTNKFYFQAEAQVRALANADTYGNLKAKSYLRLALQEPIIPNTVFEVKPITNNSENLISNLEEINSVIIYPNPSGTGYFSITLPLNATQIKVEVFNNLGQIVFSNNYQTAIPIVNLNLQESGIYFVKTNFVLDKQDIVDYQKLLISSE